MWLLLTVLHTAVTQRGGGGFLPGHPSCEFMLSANQLWRNSQGREAGRLSSLRAGKSTSC